MQNCGIVFVKKAQMSSILLNLGMGNHTFPSRTKSRDGGPHPRMASWAPVGPIIICIHTRPYHYMHAHSTLSLYAYTLNPIIICIHIRPYHYMHTHSTLSLYAYQAWGQAPKGLSPLDLSPFLRGLKSGLKSSFNKRA